MKVRVGILGTRGIPNYYGGFEQFADYLSSELQQKDCDVSVYNSHFHEYKKSNRHIVYFYVFRLTINY